MTPAKNAGMSSGLKKSLEVAIKLCIFILLFFAIYKQVFRNQDASQALESLQTSFGPSSVFILIVVVALMILNWGIEAFKWHQLINKVEAISYKRSLLATFSGVTFTLFTPNRIGEYGGRFLFLKKPFSLDALLVTILGSFSQIIVTLTFGVIAFFALPGSYFPDIQWNSTWIKILLMIVTILILVGYINIDMLYDRLQHVNERIKKAFQALKLYTKPELVQILSLSTLRYLVYSFQYLLLFYVFGVSILSPEGFRVVAFIFFVLTIVPSIAALELGIRGNVALFMLSSYPENNIGIMAATFSLWFINLVVPSIIGFIFMLSVKIFKKEGS